jgi:hypothetical protein
MPIPPPLDLAANEQLRTLRWLDPRSQWTSLRDRRRCLGCGELFTGREIEVFGGTRASGPLRVHCPTENCGAGPQRWVAVNAPHADGNHEAEEVVVSHHGRAVTLRRTRSQSKRILEAASANPLERCQEALRGLIHLLDSPDETRAQAMSKGRDSAVTTRSGHVVG